jgi:YidC/Oxa1 family membrane protein insertase
LPFFIGFYNVLTVAIELRHASWLWVTDLSAPETLAIRVLPVAMVLTQFWQQTMTPTPTADPAQMRLMKFMPLNGFSSGLVLFWLTSNVVGVAQQYLLNRFSSDEEPVIDKPRGRRKKKAGAKAQN